MRGHFKFSTKTPIIFFLANFSPDLTVRNLTLMGYVAQSTGPLLEQDSYYIDLVPRNWQMISDDLIKEVLKNMDQGGRFGQGAQKTWIKDLKKHGVTHGSTVTKHAFFKTPIGYPRCSRDKYIHYDSSTNSCPTVATHSKRRFLLNGC